MPSWAVDHQADQVAQQEATFLAELYAERQKDRTRPAEAIKIDQEHLDFVSEHWHKSMVQTLGNRQETGGTVLHMYIYSIYIYIRI